ncbi:MAG: TolC family outer membrane protein [Pseudomonadota bacterium]|nr:TolC family outer membrane protein [Pseudomonadota bacterium]
MALIVTCLLSTNLFAENLEEIFALARKNDPEWAAQKQKYLADSEKVEQAFGTLLPNAEFTGSWGKQYYKGSTAVWDVDGGINCLLTEAPGNLDDLTAGDIFPLLEACDESFANEVDRTEDYTATLYDITVAQPLFRLERWNRYKRAKSANNAAKAQLALSQQALMIRSAEAYFGVLRAQEELRLARAEEKTLHTQLSGVKNRYKLGLLRDTDVFELQAQHDMAKAAVIVAESQLEVMKENLALLTGVYIDMINPLPQDIPIEPPQPYALSEWEDFAKRTNYQLIAAQYAADAAEKELSEKKAGHAPTADLFLQHEKREVGGGFIPSFDRTTIGVRVSVPLYSGGITSSQVREADHRLQEARHNLELARRNALRETRQYHTQVKANVATVQARLRAVKSNNSSLRAIRDGWENGIRTLTDAITAQRKVFQARKEYATSRYDYILNTLKLKKAAGVLSPDDLQTLNSWLDSPSDTVSSVLDESESYLQEVDDVKFERELKSFEDEKKDETKSHKSLYDAFKAWREGN